jgi:hypothetical protein
MGYMDTQPYINAWNKIQTHIPTIGALKHKSLDHCDQHV